MEAAKWVEKVRINPGNYADSKKFAIKEYTDDQYAAELIRIEEKFTPLVKLCKDSSLPQGTALSLYSDSGCTDLRKNYSAGKSTLEQLMPVLIVGDEVYMRATYSGDGLLVTSFWISCFEMNGPTFG